MNVLKFLGRRSPRFDQANWLGEAERALSLKQAALENEFGLGHWARWNSDLACGRLSFADDEVTRVVADVQIVGTVGVADWRWAWANDHLPAPYVLDSVAVKRFGDEHGIADFTKPSVEHDDLEALGWRLTAAAVRMSNALGAYCAPTGAAKVFLSIKTMNWVEPAK